MIAAIPAPRSAQENTPAGQLVGAWTYVSTVNTRADGTKFEPYGASATGILVFEPNGYFSWQIIRPDIPKFASNNRMYGTLEEFKDVAMGILSYFGTYSANAKGGITMHITASSFPNFNGQVQDRAIMIQDDELTVSNQLAASGGSADVKWKRLK